MDVQRLQRDVTELQRDYPVKWSVDKHYVMITQFGYPRGWTPRTAPLFLSIPHSYPRQPPEVYLPPVQGPLSQASAYPERRWLDAVVY